MKCLEWLRPDKLCNKFSGRKISFLGLALSFPPFSHPFWRDYTASWIFTACFTVHQHFKGNGDGYAKQNCAWHSPFHFILSSSRNFLAPSKFIIRNKKRETATALRFKVCSAISVNKTIKQQRNEKLFLLSAQAALMKVKRLRLWAFESFDNELLVSESFEGGKLPCCTGKNLIKPTQ